MPQEYQPLNQTELETVSDNVNLLNRSLNPDRRPVRGQLDEITTRTGRGADQAILIGERLGYGRVIKGVRIYYQLPSGKINFPQDPEAFKLGEWAVIMTELESWEDWTGRGSVNRILLDRRKESILESEPFLNYWRNLSGVRKPAQVVRLGLVIPGHVEDLGQSTEWGSNRGHMVLFTSIWKFNRQNELPNR